MKPLTKEQFETITKWLANDPDVIDMVYRQFLKDFGNTQEDPDPKAPEPWQWQLCPKCHGEKTISFSPLGTSGKVWRDCPVCEGEGKLKIPQSPVDMGKIKELINEATKGQPNQISSFFTDEKKAELFAATGLAINKAYKNGEYPPSDLEEYWYYIGAGDMRAIIWDMLKEIAKQKQNDNQQNSKTNA